MFKQNGAALGPFLGCRFDSMTIMNHVSRPRRVVSTVEIFQTIVETSTSLDQMKVFL